MPLETLETAKKILNNSKATKKEVDKCINQVERKVGELSCQSNSEPKYVPRLIELEKALTELYEKQNLLASRISFLQQEIPRVEAVVKGLEAGGVETYNNQSERIFEKTYISKDGGKTFISSDLEEYPSQIFEKRGEDILQELKNTLANYKRELINLTAD